MTAKLIARKVATLVDDEGGRYQVRPEPEPVRCYGKGWAIVFDEARREIVDSLRNASTLRVFLALPDYLSWTDWHRLNQGRLCMT